MLKFVQLQCLCWTLVFCISFFLGSLPSSSSSEGEGENSHEVNRRVYYTQNVIYTSYIYTTTTQVYTPPVKYGEQNYIYDYLPPETRSVAPPCNNPWFRSEFYFNKSTCYTHVYIRVKAPGDRNFSFFEATELPWIALKNFPDEQSFHWAQLRSYSGVRFYFTSNPFQPPPEFASFYMVGKPVGAANSTVYVADYYGNVCKETMVQPLSMDFNCKREI